MSSTLSEPLRAGHLVLPVSKWSVSLAILFLASIVRLWIIPLPSSFWVDEMGTAFVVHYGPNHPSFAVAPQVPASIYYALPRGAEALFGFSEVSYRLPSILAMGLAMLLIAKLASRLIHPQAGWFAVFACLGLRDIDYEAADARPYALGICIAAAALWFLVNWLDSAKWRDAILFVIFAALVWRVHLVFWPFYGVFAIYALVRFLGRDTKVDWRQLTTVALLVALALIPVLQSAVSLAAQAKAHVIAAAPNLRNLTGSLKWNLILPCAIGAALLYRWFPKAKVGLPPSWGSLALIFGWWLSQPLALFAFSHLTGNSLFVPRYLVLALPGAALTATVAAALYIPAQYWKQATLLFGVGVLWFTGQWRVPAPSHHNSDWRTASSEVNQLAIDSDTPVIYPSPFIEAQWPVWRPDYALPGFLYSHVPVYPVRGKPILFPFESSKEAEEYALSLTKSTLVPAGRFVLYGGAGPVGYWWYWFALRPEFETWRIQNLGRFGDVGAVLFERPVISSERTKIDLQPSTP